MVAVLAGASGEVLPEDVFILGGVGGMGFVGGVGACMNKTPFMKSMIWWT